MGKLLILFITCLSLINGKLVFKPGSDIGYILPDEDDFATYDKEKKQYSEKKTKRQLMHTIFDSIGGVDEWSRLQSKERKRVLEESDNIPNELRDQKHGIQMGIANKHCDDAKTALERDWNGSPTAFTCYTPKWRLPVSNIVAQEICEDVPRGYIPQHHCMDKVISYETKLPTFGDHRPLWPIYGEYNYVPPQRWLHSVEHGSIVMLYHPCTAPVIVQQLKSIVKQCIYKHVISAYTGVSLDRPLVLIAWGCKLEMSHVDEERVKNFIKNKALHGPEGTLSKQGLYDFHLLDRSIPPKFSDINDTTLCPAS